MAHFLKKRKENFWVSGQTCKYCILMKRRFLLHANGLLKVEELKPLDSLPLGEGTNFDSGLF